MKEDKEQDGEYGTQTKPAELQLIKFSINLEKMKTNYAGICQYSSENKTEKEKHSTFVFLIGEYNINLINIQYLDVEYKQNTNKNTNSGLKIYRI